MNSQLAFDMVRAETDLHFFARRFAKTLKVEPDDFGLRPYPYDDFPWLREYLSAFLRFWGRGKGVIAWQKSGQMMASWSVATSFVWAIGHHNDKNLLMISQKQKLVDDRFHTVNSLMGKCKVIIENLPDHWRRQYRRLEMGWRNDATGSAIMGETANPDAGRGGGWAAVEMDEAAFNEFGEENFGACKTRCYGPLIMTSTPNPRKSKGADVMSRILFDPKPTTTVVRIATPWTVHPNRDQSWHDAEAETLTPGQLRAEIDMKWGKALSTECMTLWRRETFVRPTPFIPGLPVWRVWDPSSRHTAILYAQVKDILTNLGNVVYQFRIIGLYEAQGKPHWHYQDNCQAKAGEFPLGQEFVDLSDPYIMDSTESDGMSWSKNLQTVEKRDGYPITLQPCDCRNVSAGNMIENALKPMKVVRDENGTEIPLLSVHPTETAFIEHAENYTWITDRHGEIVDPGDPKPLKDKHSHAMDCYQYLVWQNWPMRGGRDIEQGDIETLQTDEISEGLLVGSSLRDRPFEEGGPWHEDSGFKIP